MTNLVMDAFAPAPTQPAAVVDPDVAWMREQLAAIDAKVAAIHEIETQLRDAEQKKRDAQASADDMAAAVAQQTIERLRKAYDQGGIGKLSGERSNLVSNFEGGGANVHRLKVLDRAITELEQALTSHKSKLESLELGVNYAKQRLREARRPSEERQALAGVKEAEERVKFWRDVLDVMSKPIRLAQEEINSIRGARRAALFGE